jgi:hypothetical protein
VRDRRFRGQLARGARRIDVDPLAVFGGGRELVDPLLRNVEPVADGYLLAEAVAQGDDAFDLGQEASL